MLGLPDVFEIADPRGGRMAAWATALAITALVVGTTVALVAVNYVPGEDFQVMVGR